MSDQEVSNVRISVCTWRCQSRGEVNVQTTNGDTFSADSYSLIGLLQRTARERGLGERVNDSGCLKSCSYGPRIRVSYQHGHSIVRVHYGSRDRDEPDYRRIHSLEGVRLEDIFPDSGEEE